METIINSKGVLPTCMAKGEIVLYQKGPNKENEVGNFQPISSLLLTWKLLPVLSQTDIIIWIINKFCKMNRNNVDIITRVQRTS